MLITISGPDGVGKSSLIESLQGVLSDKGISCVSFHHREISKPKSLLDKEITSSKSVTNENVLKRLVKAFLKPLRLHYLKEELNYVRILNKNVKQAKNNALIVIVDRYVFDRIVQFSVFKRLNIWRYFVLNAGKKILPKPDLAIILGAAPNIIRQRKAELNMQEIEHYLRDIETVYRDEKLNFVVYDTGKKQPHEIAQEILDGQISYERNA